MNSKSVYFIVLLVGLVTLQVCKDVDQNKKSLINNIIPLALNGGYSTQSQAIEANTSLARSVTSPINTSGRSALVQTEIQNANAFITDSSARFAKYTDMKASAFSFYRATNHLYYKDMNSGMIAIPSLWKTTANTKTWIQGDLHTQNVGFFDNDNGSVKLDLNDFDESYLAPFYWDLIRITTSIFLQRNEVGFNFSLTEARASVDSFLQEYQDTLTAVNGNGTEKTIELTESNLAGFTQTTLKDLKNTKSNSTLLSKWTTVVNGNRVFDFSNPDLQVLNPTELTELQNYWNTYLTDLGSTYTSKGSSYFTIKDRARRMNSGLGSQGVYKFYILIQGPSTSNSDDILLEVKEEKLPSMFYTSSISQTLYNSYFTNHADRAKTAYKAMIVNVDNLAGVLKSNTHAYLVRKMSAYKYGFDPSDFKSKTDFNNYLKYVARATAYSHSRADNDYSNTYINYNFENSALSAISFWPSTKGTIRDLGESYASQVQVDYNFFVSLLNAGQIQ